MPNNSTDGGNVVFSLVRFVASIRLFFPFFGWKLETKKLSRPMAKLQSKIDWSHLLFSFIRRRPTTAKIRKKRKTLSMPRPLIINLCHKNCLEIHLQGSTVTERVSDILLCHKALSNISLRSHHNSNFNKYRVSGHEICFFFRLFSFRCFHYIGFSMATNNNIFHHLCLLANPKTSLFVGDERARSI